jgi:hypothetical protein
MSKKEFTGKSYTGTEDFIKIYCNWAERPEMSQNANSWKIKEGTIFKIGFRER